MKWCLAHVDNVCFVCLSALLMWVMCDNQTTFKTGLLSLLVTAGASYIITATSVQLALFS